MSTSLISPAFMLEVQGIAKQLTNLGIDPNSAMGIDIAEQLLRKRRGADYAQQMQSGRTEDIQRNRQVLIDKFGLKPGEALGTALQGQAPKLPANVGIDPRQASAYEAMMIPLFGLRGILGGGVKRGLGEAAVQAVFTAPPVQEAASEIMSTAAAGALPVLPFAKPETKQALRRLPMGAKLGIGAPAAMTLLGAAADPVTRLAEELLRRRREKLGETSSATGAW